MRFKLIYILIFLAGCTEKISFDDPEEDPPISIFGYITDREDSHIIYVGTSVGYSSRSFIFRAFNPIFDASVLLMDDLGNEHILSPNEKIFGTYKTEDTFRGVPGRSYKISVEIPGRGTYESEWSTIGPKPQIEKLEIEPYTTQVLKNDILINERGIIVNTHINDPPSTPNYYRFRWNGVYEIRYSFDSRGSCWVTEKDIDYLNVLHDSFLDGTEIIHPTVVIPFENRTNARNKYVASVEMLSISQDDYDYYSKVDKQRELQGSLFDPTPAQIFGNIKSTDNSEELVLGYFHASGSSVERISIETIIQNRGDDINCNEFAENGFPAPQYCGNCELITNASRDKPEWY